MDFAVHIPGLHQTNADGQKTGSWVLAVSGDAVLIAHEDQSLHWQPLTECELLKAATPEQPRLVVAIPPPERPGGIIQPDGQLFTNRAMRRHP